MIISSLFSCCNCYFYAFVLRFMQQVTRENTLRSNAKRFHLQHNTYHLTNSAPLGVLNEASSSLDVAELRPVISKSKDTRNAPVLAKTETEKEKELAKSVLTGYEQQPERRLFDDRPLRCEGLKTYTVRRSLSLHALAKYADIHWLRQHL